MRQQQHVSWFRFPCLNLIKLLAASTLCSTFAMSPVLLNISTAKFGPNLHGVGSDSYGYLYSIWLNSQAPDGKYRNDTKDLMLGLPSGRPLTHHIELASWIGNQLAVAGLSPILAYNLITWWCFFLAFFLGFLILKALRVSDGVAYLGGFLIELLPYQSLQSVDHPDLAMTGGILLDIWLLIRLTVHRDARAVPALIFLTGISVFTHPYYLVCLAIINTLPLLHFAFETVGGKIRVSFRDWILTAAGAGLALSSVLFWRSLFASSSPGGSSEGVARDFHDLYTYSTKFWDFILPPHFSLLFSGLTADMKLEQTARSGTNYVENTLYPGALALLIGAVTLACAVYRRKKTLDWLSRNRALAFALANIVIIPILFSVSPTQDLFGLEVPMPIILVNKFIPSFRTISRLGYVSTVGFVLLALLVFDHFLARVFSKAFARAAVQGAVAVFCLFDYGYFHEAFYSNSQFIPPAYQYLKDATPENSVIFELPLSWGYIPLYWLSYHHRKHFGLFDPTDPDYPKAVSAAHMDLGHMVAFLAENKVDYLVIHNGMDIPLPGLKFENKPDKRWIFYEMARYSYVIKIKP